MEQVMSKADFKSSKLYESISKEIREYMVKEAKDCGIYLNFSEVKRDMNRQKEQMLQVLSKEDNHIYTKSQVEDIANRELQRKMNLFRSYFESGNEDNISNSIAKYYADIIVSRIEVWKRAIRVWVKANNVDCMDEKIVLNGVNGAEVIIDLYSSQKCKSNLQRVIAQYIDDNILDNSTYTDDFYDSDIKVTIEDYIPLKHVDLSPFEETMRKLTGIYSAWTYNLDTLYMEEKVNDAAKYCERDVFRSGFIQDVTHSIFNSFLQKLEKIGE